MAARVCKTCWINYEIGNLRCAVCGSELEHLIYEVPHSDVEERVTKARASLQQSVEEAMADAPSPAEMKTMVWRFTRLRDHGLDFDAAIELARRREPEGGFTVDVHRFTKLVDAGATVDQAVRILG